MKAMNRGRGGKGKERELLKIEEVMDALAAFKGVSDGLELCVRITSLAFMIANVSKVKNGAKQQADKAACSLAARFVLTALPLRLHASMHEFCYNIWISRCVSFVVMDRSHFTARPGRAAEIEGHIVSQPTSFCRCIHRCT